jgi:hypothetical protein
VTFEQSQRIPWMQPCDVRADLKTRIERKEALGGDF